MIPPTYRIYGFPALCAPWIRRKKMKKKGGHTDDRTAHFCQDDLPKTGVKSTALKQHPNIETEQERFVMI